MIPSHELASSLAELFGNETPMPSPSEILDKFIEHTKDVYLYDNKGQVVDVIISPKSYEIILPTTHTTVVRRYIIALRTALCRKKTLVEKYNRKVRKHNAKYPNAKQTEIYVPYWRMSVASTEYKADHTVLTLSRKQSVNFLVEAKALHNEFAAVTNLGE